jgi:predicted secreted protein|tara:strand:- start:662 stop:1054 length:393 start_codon:yes stop_codon:yes gene_type:complete
MANHTGSEGMVKVGGTNTVGELRSWSLSHESETIEDTAMGDSFRSHKAGLQTWSGSCDVYFDETDTSGQVALTPGASLTIGFYPEGADSGDTYYSGTALVTSVERSAELDGMVEQSISLTGVGGLTTATV